MGADGEPPTLDEQRLRALLQESRDLAASKAEHAIRLGHLYLVSASMAWNLADWKSAELDRSRAECLFQWAKDISQDATPAGRRLLNTELRQLKAELDAFQPIRDVSAAIEFVLHWMGSDGSEIDDIRHTGDISHRGTRRCARW